MHDVEYRGHDRYSRLLSKSSTVQARLGSFNPTLQECRNQHERKFNGP